MKSKVKLRKVWKKFTLERENFSFLKEKAIGEFFRTKIKEEIWALRDVSFDLAENECLGIIGKNASGKTTLLRIIAGILFPTKGKVYVSGKVAPFLGLGSGFEEELTGKENVYLQASLLGMKKSQIDKIYSEIVEFSELFDFTDIKLKNYSEGMKARLGFSIMAFADADILLIDDILAVGDAHFQKRCAEKIKELKGEGKTIVLVTHNLEAVKKYCDLALYLHRGKVMDFGDSERVASEYESHLNSGFVEYPMLGSNLEEKNKHSLLQIKKEYEKFGIEKITFPLKIKREDMPVFEILLGEKREEKVLLTLNNHIHSFQLIGVPKDGMISIFIDPKWLMKGDYMVNLNMISGEKNIRIPYPFYFSVEDENA